MQVMRCNTAPDLTRGPAGASPLYPPGLGASVFTLAPRTVWPLHHHSRERSCFPRNPHDPRENSLSLWTPIANSIEANPARIGCTIMGCHSPDNPRPTFRSLDTAKGAFRAPCGTPRPGFGAMPLHLDQTRQQRAIAPNFCYRLCRMW